MNKTLERLYYNLPQPTAYAGADKLLKQTRKKFDSHDVISWLESQDAYNLHKLARKRFPRRNYNVRNLDDVWEADLMDLRSLKSYNNGYTYILTVIDVLSKYAWVQPIKDKSSLKVSQAFEKILKRSNLRKPICLQTDKGKEFVGKEMQQLLKKQNIQYRVVRSPDTKAAIAERFIRTIKERVWRYFTYKKTRRYIDVLEKIVTSYNHSKHSATKMIPAEVTLFNAAEARKNLQKRYRQNRFRCPKYSVGDLVRVSRAKNVFEKGYEGGWTHEIFEIFRVDTSRQPVVYFLKDLAGENIDGYFYQEELSRVRKNLDEEVFEVEKIIKSTGEGSGKKYFVKWKGYPDKFNSWVEAKDLKSLQ